MRKNIQKISSTTSWSLGPGDNFDFGINYKACGFCKFAARHGDQEILPHICGLDFEAYATRGIRLERTQTLAGGASHCNFSVLADRTGIEHVFGSLVTERC
jgi:hypothetical protein